MIKYFVIVSLLLPASAGLTLAAHAASTAQRDAPTVRFYDAKGNSAGTATTYGPVRASSRAAIRPAAPAPMTTMFSACGRALLDLGSSPGLPLLWSDFVDNPQRVEGAG
jgi:hypothetical protein